MADESPTRRVFAKDLSNMQGSDIPTPTKSVQNSPARSANAVPAKSSPSPSRCWTSADQFKFVEEDDDEVLFRVRDSGVLRSLTNSAVSMPAALSAEDSIEEKQVLAIF